MCDIIDKLGRQVINSQYGLSEYKPSYRGYELDHLIACTMLLESKGITPEKLKDGFEMYKLGYIDGQNYRIEETNVIVGKWLDSFEIKLNVEGDKPNEVQ